MQCTFTITGVAEYMEPVSHLLQSCSCSRPEQCGRVLDVSSTEGYASASHRTRKRDVPAVSAVSGEDRYHPSPYPLVDQFISSQLFKEGVQGHIRKWTWFTQGKLGQERHR